ncbi:MAG: glycerate kinase [bacterium]
MYSLLIAPNSFKECINSVDLAKLIENNIKSISLSDKNISFNTILAPISDGGDGFLSVCENYFSLKKYSFSVLAPNKTSIIDVFAGIDTVKKICFIESADVVGIKISPVFINDPYIFNSYGLGELLFKLNEFNIYNGYLFNKIVIGIGGTCINDLGLGVGEYFGLKLFDSKNEKLKVQPINYSKASKIEWKKPNLSFDIELVIDIYNELLGKDGAIYCFGKQKGIKNEDLRTFELGFENILNILEISIKNRKKLSGAGGGLAAGLFLFFNAKIKTAADFILKDLEINKINADVLITGEGCFDYQSSLNKGAYILINFFNSRINDIFVISGKKDGVVDVKKKDTIIYLEDFFGSAEESIINIEMGIELACKKIVNKILTKGKNGK